MAQQGEDPPDALRRRCALPRLDPSIPPSLAYDLSNEANAEKVRACASEPKDLFASLLVS